MLNRKATPENFKLKATPEKFKELEETAIMILTGEASLLPDYNLTQRQQAWFGERLHGRKKVADVLRALRQEKTPTTQSSLSLRNIAKKHSVPIGIVQQISTSLSKRKGTQRKNYVKTPVYPKNAPSHQEIEDIIERFLPKIRRRARALAGNPKVRALFGDEQEIADRIIDDLREYLPRHDPTRSKLNYYVLKLIYWRGNIIFRRAKGKKLTHGFDEHRGDAAVKKPEQMIQPQVEAIIDNLNSQGLSQPERALILARIAGINLARAGNILGGLSRQRVSQFLKKISPKLGLKKTIRIVSQRPKRVRRGK